MCIKDNPTLKEFSFAKLKSIFLSWVVFHGSRAEKDHEERRRWRRRRKQYSTVTTRRITRNRGRDVWEDDRTMDEAGNGKRSASEHSDRSCVQCDSSEAKPYDRDCSKSQQLCSFTSFCLRPDMDQDSQEIRFCREAIHKTREHNDSDICCCLLRHRGRRLRTQLSSLSFFPVPFRFLVKQANI